MTFYLTKPAMNDAIFVVTKVPRSGPKVDYERISPIAFYGWKLAEHQFWQARKFSNIDTARKALAIVHAAGHEEFAVTENPWENRT